MNKRQINDTVLAWIIYAVYWLIMIGTLFVALLFLVESRWSDLLDPALLKKEGTWLVLACIVSVGLVLYSWGHKRHSGLGGPVIMLTLGGLLLYGCVSR